MKLTRERPYKPELSLALISPLPSSLQIVFAILVGLTIGLSVFATLGIVPVQLTMAVELVLAIVTVYMGIVLVQQNRTIIPKRSYSLLLIVILTFIGFLSSMYIRLYNLHLAPEYFTSQGVLYSEVIFMSATSLSKIILMLIPVYYFSLRGKHEGIVSTFFLDVLAMAGALFLVAMSLSSFVALPEWAGEETGYYLNALIVSLDTVMMSAMAAMLSRSDWRSRFSFGLFVLALVASLTYSRYATADILEWTNWFPDHFVLLLIILGVIIIQPFDKNEQYVLVEPSGITQSVNQWVFFVVVFAIPGSTAYLANEAGAPYDLKVIFIFAWVIACLVTTRFTYTIWIESKQRTQVQRVQNELKVIVYKDKLTGLNNRTELVRMLNEELAEVPVILLSINLNRFKIVNDMAGHGAGDEVLCLVAKRLSGFESQDCRLFHLGADEFVFLLVDNGSYEPIALAKEIRMEFQPPFFVCEKEWFLGIRIGISNRSSSRNLDSFALVANANTAMDRADGTADGFVQIFDATMTESIAAKHNQEVKLRHAIDNGRIIPVFQAIVNIASGTIAGFETLARWQQPDGSLTSAVAFIDIAEACGLDKDIDRLMLEGACDFISMFNMPLPRDQQVWITVNVAPSDLIGGDVSQRIADNIKRTRINPNWLVVELTESALEGNEELAAQLIMDIHNLGVGLAIDDFGTGYSSLGHLMNFPVDILKVDKSFITNVASYQESRQSMANAVLTITDSLGFPAIAEGIEDLRQAKVLNDMGYPLGQGFLYSKPLIGIEAIGLRGSILGRQPARR